MSIGGHQSPVNLTDVWLTPPWVLEALGEFDLDPCAPPPPRPWVTAKTMVSLPYDGLGIDWDGRVWMNPPYGGPSIIGPWMKKMVAHGRGMALIFARTETEMFHRDVWQSASGLLFFEGRLHFHHADGTRAKANAGAPSVLVAYGDEDREVLAESLLPGQFVPLRLPKSYVVYAVACSWRETVWQWLAAQEGPVKVSDLYEALASHPKVKGKKHWREKIRQTLQRGPFAPVGEGKWVAA